MILPDAIYEQLPIDLLSLFKVFIASDIISKKNKNMAYANHLWFMLYIEYTGFFIVHNKHKLNITFKWST